MVCLVLIASSSAGTTLAGHRGSLRHAGKSSSVASEESKGVMSAKSGDKSVTNKLTRRFGIPEGASTLHSTCADSTSVIVCLRSENSNVRHESGKPGDSYGNSRQSLTNGFGAILADGSSSPLSRSRVSTFNDERCARSREGYPVYGNTGSREYEEHIGAFPSKSDLLIPTFTPNACARGLQLIDRYERELASRGSGTPLPWEYWLRFVSGGVEWGREHMIAYEVY